MRKSFFFKYFLLGWLLVLASFIILGFSLSAQVYNYSVGEKERALEEVAVRVSDMTTEVMAQFPAIPRRTFQFLISSSVGSESMHAVLCNTDGEVIATSDHSDIPATLKIPPVTLKRTLKNKYYSSSGSLGEIYKGENYTVGVPYKNPKGELAGCVYVTTSLSDMRGLLIDILKMFFISAIIAFFLMAIMTYIGIRTMTRPIKKISNAAKSFARGDFSIRVPVKSQDEIGELTQAFNTMADSIEKSDHMRQDFISNVSHELRSPMTSIGGYADGILDGVIPPEEERKYLEIISSETRRLSRLVSRMLDITRMQSEDITAGATRYDFCEQVRRVIIGFEKRIEEKNIILNVSFSSERIELFANSDAIYQVIYNLLENSTKFSPIGGEVTIDVSTHNGKLWFSIKNGGSAIPEEELPFVFDRFHKADHSRTKDKTGLGLGLFIAKTIVNQHNGKIGAQSSDGETEFYFSLPL